MTKKICVIGGGRWGANHVRTLYEMGCLGGIVEKDRQRLDMLLRKYPVEGFDTITQAIDKKCDGYVVATPAVSHYTIGKRLLQKGLNTLIEKPMTLKSGESKELVELSRRNGAALMVGHILLFHPAIQKIKASIQSGEIGKLFYIYSTRLNLGTVRTEENVFWSFAPHDISVMNDLAGASPIRIYATGGKFLQRHIDDVTLTQFTYPDHIHAHIFVSWLHPFKEQRLVAIGSEGMISFDDASVEKSILLYRKKIAMKDSGPVKVEKPDEIIPYEKVPPLQNELAYFIEHMDSGIEIANGENGQAVVEILEQAQTYLS